MRETRRRSIISTHIIKPCPLILQLIMFSSPSSPLPMVLLLLLHPLLILTVVDGLSSIMAPQHQFLGVDLGTSGARISIIQHAASTTTTTSSAASEDAPSFDEIYAKALAWDTYGSYDEPNAWMKAVQALLQSAADTMSLENVHAICISGTSASCLLVEPDNDNNSSAVIKPTRGNARMYNYNVDNAAALDLLSEFVPPRHTARSTTGSLAKLLAWNAEDGLSDNERLCHQADYVIRQFTQRSDVDVGNNNCSIVSDWHNCLKLGYDVRNLEWPSWMDKCLESVGLSTCVLPDKIVSPGQPIGSVASWACDRFGLPEDCVLTGGTTDSNAAFFAAVGSSVHPGTAVTSLGSTLAIKQLSTAYVEDAEKGVYSHRFPSVFGSFARSSSSSSEAWLVGGASNSGCAVLREQGFSNEELVELSQKIDPDSDTSLSYYPLTKKGERFPIADSGKEPILEPVPKTRDEFLRGILQGISDVERDGFLALGELGALPSTPSHVWTCGGGSRNNVWSQMRQRRLREAFKTDVTVARANNTEASYGAAILAAASK